MQCHRPNRNKRKYLSRPHFQSSHPPYHPLCLELYKSPQHPPRSPSSHNFPLPSSSSTTFFNMLLIQKATAFPTTSLHGNVHRRHPSAPSPVVQPTRTPGLLTLSKPLQQQQQPHPRQRQLPRSKQTPQKSAARSQQQENVVALKPSPEIVDKKSVATTPADKSQARGRQQAKSKDKPTTR